MKIGGGTDIKSNKLNKLSQSVIVTKIVFFNIAYNSPT